MGMLKVVNPFFYFRLLNQLIKFAARIVFMALLLAAVVLAFNPFNSRDIAKEAISQKVTNFAETNSDSFSEKLPEFKVSDYIDLKTPNVTGFDANFKEGGGLTIDVKTGDQVLGR